MLLLALICVEVATACLPTNPTPVIGILTQPVEAAYQTYGDQYVPASYVKWVESAGARVFFVHYDASQSDLKLLLKTQLNGLVFPGGDADITDGLFAETSRYLLQLVMEINNQADYFPLWATCQGMQQVSIYTANDTSVLVNRTAENILFSLNFTNNAQYSRTMSQASQQVWDALTYETITVNNHNYGVDPMSFKTNSNLYNNYTVLATNFDVYGNEFVSYFEGFSLPIYGSQFHPEKNAFEWNQEWSVLDGAHIPDAIVTMQYFSEFLVRESIKSQHNFTTGVSTAGELAYTVSPTYTGNIDPYWEQIYFFDDYLVDSKQFL